ncbi:MAG TPA: PKD domain-containing protein, partial [Cyclobacteriaceae bacterium]|nr:PKD domain-containing protein [Cyclobacteriaceae bacterium]
MLHSIVRTACLLVLLLGAGKAYSQVDFKADVTSGCFPLTVHFTDLTPGSTKWEWDFGNNNRSELQNPSAVFAAPGTYSVTLKATVGGVENARIKANFVVVHGFPEVDFTFDKLTGCSPLTVRFNDKTSTTSGTVTGWFWAFGDGGSSQSANPTHIFQQSGDYTITLKARNEHGCEKSKTVESGIKVIGPKTKFSADKTAVCSLPATFKLTNETTGDQPLTYSWNFGDGSTSTEVNPQHTYTKSGAFTATLKAKDAAGCESTFQLTLNAGSEGGLDFNASSFKVCVDEEVSFTAISSDPIVSSSWDFDDTGTSNVNDPKHTYTEPGIYNVVFTAELLGHTCTSLITKKIEVATPATPSFTSTVDCSYNVTLTSTSQNAKRVEWYINDALSSTATTFVSPVKAAGVQTVKLIAYDAADCNYSIEQVIDIPINPVVSFTPDEQQSCSGNSLSGCAPFHVNFEGKVLFSDTNIVQWNFGDGMTSTNLKQEHVYNSAGLFQVTLTATNSRGCKSTSTAFVVVSKTTPTADFTMDRTVACAGEEVTFTEKSLNADFWCWNFGDGGSDTGKSVTYKYPRPGTYTVTLTAKNAGCTDVKVIQNAITIKDPYVNFTSAKTCADPFNISLNNVSKNYDVIEWDFGDGEKSTSVQVGSHRYAIPGTYVMSLTGTNHSTGCTTIAYNTFIIQQVEAKFDLDNPTPCKGAPMTFTDKSGGAAQWSWVVGPNNSKEQNFTTSIKTPGDYTAKLEVTDIDGCKAVSTKAIKVVDMEAAFSFTASSTCDEFLVDFKDGSVGSPSPTTWDWQFGDGNTGSGKTPSNVYLQPGIYSVTLSVSNGQGSCDYVKTGAINFTIPEPNFATAKTNFCIGEQVIVANTTKDAAFFEWDYGDGRRADFRSPVITYDKTGQYDLTLFARDVFGCERKITKPHLV